MKSFRALLLPAFLFTAGALSAQPVVNLLVDASAQTPNIAQGSYFFAKGTSLSASGYVTATAPAYPTTLNNVSISLTPTGGGTAIQALMVYTYNLSGVNQVAAILPSTVPLGTYNLRVVAPAGTSAPVPVTVVQRKPGVNSSSQDGLGVAQATLQGALILQSTSAQGLIGLYDTRPAHPGDVMTLWGTGLGPDILSDSGIKTSGDMTSAASIRVLLDGVEIVPAYAGRSQGYPGLDQVNFTIPNNVVLSCTNTVQVRAGGVLSNLLTIATSAASATSCPAPTGGGGTTASPITQSELNTLISSGQFRLGNASISKTTTYTIQDSLTGGAPTTSSATSESFDASFTKLSGTDLSAYVNATYANFTSGSCNLITANPAVTYPNLTTTPLDAGASQSVNGALGLKTAARTSSATNISYDAPLPTGYVAGGVYTISGPGGANVGSYSTSYTIAGTELIWTNRTSITSIDRTKAQDITWSGGDPNGQVTISGSSFTSASNIGIFNCTAPTSAGHLTIPSAILSQLPASSVISGGGINFVTRGNLSVSSGDAKRITVSGVDYFVVDHSFETSTQVQYK